MIRHCRFLALSIPALVVGAAVWAAWPEPEVPLVVHLVRPASDSPAEVSSVPIRRYLGAIGYPELEVAFADSSQVGSSLVEVGTAGALRTLRHEIETRYSGAERTAFLESFVPFLRVPPEAPLRACQQLEDAITYANWNFGGVGFWLDDATRAAIEGCG